MRGDAGLRREDGSADDSGAQEVSAGVSSDLPSAGGRRPLRSLNRVARPAWPGRLTRLDGVLLLLGVLLLGWTLAGDLDVSFEFGTVAPSLDLVFDTIGLLATFGVAGLAWLRYLDSGSTISLFQASAFLVLAIPNAAHLMVMTGNPAVVAGLSLGDQGQAPLYSFAAAGLTAAILLVLGSTAFGGARRPRSNKAVIVLPAAAVLGVIWFARAWPDLVPALGSVSGSAGRASGFPEVTFLGATINAITAALFLVAAVLSRRLVRRSGTAGAAYLAVGLLLAAFAQVDGLLDPSYAGLVSDADLLRLSFYFVLLLGLTADIVATVRELRASRDELEGMKDLEVERAALEERGRLSRELHDGLAQRLWTAKLKAVRLAAAPDLPADLRLLADEVSGAVDAGLEEARQAVTTLRLEAEPGNTVGSLLSRAVDDFEDRFGIRAEFECPSDIPRLPVRSEAELLRIAQEALSNVARHADATFVTVRAVADPAVLSVSIRDNGRGFDPETVEKGHYGLVSMRERAALISAELSIDSRAHDGTTVVVRIPLPRGSSAAVVQAT